MLPGLGGASPAGGSILLLRGKKHVVQVAGRERSK